MSGEKIIDGVLVLGPTLEVSSPFLFHSRGHSLYDKSKTGRKVTKAFRISDHDYKRIEEAAKALGMSESNFLRQASLSVATSVLVAQREAERNQEEVKAIQKLDPARAINSGRTLSIAERRALGLKD